MLELFIEGGPLFMGILSLLLLVVLSMTVVNGLQVFSGKVKDYEAMRQQITYIKSVGLSSLVIGILGQLIGLFEGFGSISQMGTVSPALLTAGIRVSMITTMFGLTIFLISYVLWLGIDYRLNNSSK